MDKVQIWDTVLERLAGKISRVEFNTWFKKVEIQEIAGAGVLIACPTEMNKNWLDNKYSNIIRVNLQAVVPEIEKIYFTVDLTLADKIPKHPDKFSQKTARKLPNSPDERLPEGVDSRIIKPKFTLENYVVGPENKMAHAACQSIAECGIKDPKRYNPLYIYGDVGLGKTHLLQAAANDIKRRNPEAVVIYTTAERFTNEMIKSIKDKKTEEMRKKYRKADVLLIDDVQFFGKKDKTQVELFNTFNDLRDLEKQMIFSADCPPGELEDIMDRLSSRLGWGLTVDIKAPSFETKMQIIKEKAQEMRIILPEDVQECIATNIRSNMRELENILNKIALEMEFGETSQTVQSVSKMFRQLHPNEELLNAQSRNRGIAKNTDDIITVVSEYFQIPATDLLGTSRKQEIVFPRQMCWMLCKKVLNMSLESIGADFGGKNHTTIMHGIRKLEGLKRKDTSTARHIHALKKDLGVK